MNVSSKTVIILNCLAAAGLLLTLSVRFQWL
ncbi:stress response membrane protein YncL [Franconibacter helveticus 513]|nr:stress response membrane protein YncL [Franconibacter helveticus]MDU6926586.1 stress response membrane protein YncL [Franconibacter helveticus]